jgi:predicted flap endonuclease-1-like 5' DNA nuclease
MIYLIGHLSLWLLLTTAFAALAGWAFAAERAAEPERALRRERDNLMRDLFKLASGEPAVAGEAIESEREADALRRQLELRDGRIAQLEQAAEAARGRVDDAAGEIAELQRRLAAADPGIETAADLDAAEAVEVTETPAAEDETVALQTWRLRYFEQRVRYLEGLARAAPATSAEQSGALPLEWRAREAEARVAHLEEMLRGSAQPSLAADAANEEPPFAANADVDALLRWRLLYLERRVAYLQENAAEAPAPHAMAPAEAESERWKWRARYLEARVRHLEQRPVQAARPTQAFAPAALEPEEEAPPAPRAARRGSKPPVLAAARNGAPDDFTLIEGVSLQQQSTLYSIGVFHFDQLAAWTPDHVAWVDNYLRLRGRIEDEEWLEQAQDLAREGPMAARRVAEDEDA